MKSNNFEQLGFGLCVLTILFFAGCGSGRSPETGSGVATTEERSLDYFDSIEASGLGKVIVTFGAEDSCKVRADDNLIDSYKTQVKNGVLYLEPTSLMSPRAGLTANINTTHTVSRLKISGACEVIFRNMESSELAVESDGSVRFTATGSVDELSIAATGSLEAELFELAARKVKIVAEGSSKINCSASGFLDVKADGAVIVTHDGDARVTQETTGVSRVSAR